MSDRMNLIDGTHSVCLCNVGAPDYYAALVIASDGTQHFALAKISAIGDEAVQYDASCATVAHEQLGALPLDVIRRITICHRNNRKAPGNNT